MSKTRIVEVASPRPTPHSFPNLAAVVPAGLGCWTRWIHTVDVRECDEWINIAEVFVSNGRYAGTTEIYVENKELSKFCDAVSGFPNCVEDEREYRFGAKDEGSALGYCQLNLFCGDGAGHILIEVEIRDDGFVARQLTAKAKFVLTGCLAGDIDTFLQRLRWLEGNGCGGEATLEPSG